MKQPLFFRIILLSFLCLALTACGRTEKKAQLLFDLAAQTEQAGDRTGAITQYQQLLTTYPKSKAGQQAPAAIQRLQELIEAERKATLEAQAQAFKEASYQAIDSIVKVIDGYKAMFNRLPRKAADFDNSAFFFDRAYLAETVPRDFIVYLALNVGGSYRLWSLKGEEADGYRLEGKSASFSKVSRAEALQEIDTHFVEESRQGGMVFLAAKKP